jgi:glyoxylase-like metal-dependent hydrolase (beta-lactamase superfamily II)
VTPPGYTPSSQEWAEPGVFDVVPGVLRIPLPLPNDGLRAVNVYALVAEDGLTLIDSGWNIPEARELLLQALDTLGHGPGDIRQFLVTHMHRDHYTMAVAIRREFGGRLLLGAGEETSLRFVREPDRRPLQHQTDNLRALGADDLAKKMAAGMEGHRPDVDDWELPDEWLDAGVVTAAGHELTVVPTPGHTNGHVVFHDTGRTLLFAGDHVLPTITPSIGLQPVRPDNPLGDFLDSLALVRSRPDAMLLPAHGPVTDSVHRRVDELVAHHGARLDATQAAVAAGATTAYDVATQLKWTRREKTLDELDTFNQMLAVTETAAHLTLLVAQGRVRVADVDGVRRYTV